MNRDRRYPPSSFEQKTAPALQQAQYKATPEEVAEAKAQQERGLDLTIRQHALQAAINAASSDSVKEFLGDASLVEVAKDFYSFLKGNN